MFSSRGMDRTHRVMVGRLIGITRVICTCMWWGHINRYVSWVVFDDLVELLYSPNDHARPDDQCVVICIVLPRGCVS